MWIGHRKEIRKLTFRALALRLSETIRSDEGLTLETSASDSLYGGQFTLCINPVDKTKLPWNRKVNHVRELTRRNEFF